MSGFASPEYAQFRFRHYTTTEGLSNNTVTAIAQDGQGFLWIATYGGLNRFDGDAFKTYKNIPGDSASLCSSRVNALATDQKGRLWVGTSEGLNLYDSESDRFLRFTHNDDDSLSLLHNAITYLYFDSVGQSLWVSADPDGLCRLDLKEFQVSGKNRTARFKRYNPNAIKAITAFTTDSKENLLLFGRDANAFFYHREKDNFYKVPILHNYDENLDRKAKRVTPDKDGNYWLASGNKLFVLNLNIDPSGGTSFSLQHQLPVFTESVLSDSFGNIWVGQQQIQVVQPQTYVVQHTFFPSKRPMAVSGGEVQCMFRDDQGIVWIGTRNEGLSKCLPQPGLFKHFYPQTSDAKGLIGKEVSDILKDQQGNIWFAVYDGGLTQYNPKKEAYRHFTDRTHPDVVNEKIVDLYRDKTGNIWVGTWTGGLMKLEQRGDAVHFSPVKFATPDKYGLDCIWRINEDNDGKMWLATQEVGVVLFNPQTNECLKFPHDAQRPSSIRGNMVISLKIDTKNRLFAGTYLGLDMLDLDKSNKNGTPEFYHFSEFEAINGCRINDIFEDSNNNIWVCTDGKGLSVLSPDLKQIDTYQQGDGLPGNVVMGVMEDGFGNMWISTPNGLACLEPNTKVFQTYNQNQGLDFTTFKRGAIALFSDSSIFMGSDNGAVSFHPMGDKIQLHPSSIILERISINDTYIQPDSTETIILKNNENTLTFDLAIVDLWGDEHAYGYRLEGRDTTWQKIENSKSIRYSDLGKGHYKFEVRKMDAGKVGQENKIQLDVFVKRSTFKALWFYVVILLLSGLWFIYTRKKASKQAAENETQPEEDREKYSTSKLNASMINQIKTNLKAYMLAEKPYLDGELKQTSVAEALQVPLHELSQVLNQDLEMSFRDFINRYRVEEFKERIGTVDLEKFTIMAVAEQCGFKSKSSFYRSFKKETGQTPAEYIYSNFPPSNPEK